MSNDLVTPDNLTKELLRELYDAAIMSTSFDEDGDLKVSDGGYFCFVFPSDKMIRLMALFGTNSSAKKQRLIEFANKVNEEFIMVRATIASNNAAVFDYYIYLDGGVTRKAVVTATKRMLQVTSQAIQEHGSGLIA